MKRIAFVILLQMVCATLVQAQPKAEFDKLVHHFGTILWKNPATATFVIKNTGNKPLVISNVTASCGCTAVEWTRTPIAPGEWGEIVSIFDSKTLGRFHKSVGVYCNAEVRPIYLSMRGEVTADPKKAITMPYQIGDIKLDKDMLEFDDAGKGDTPYLELMVANTSNRVYYPVLMHLPPYLKAEAMPDSLLKDGYGKIKVTLDTNRLPKFGVTKTSVYLSRFPGDVVSEENSIPVSVVLLPDFSELSAEELLNPPALELSRTEIDFGALAVNERKSQNVVIRNTGKRNLEIIDLQVFDSSLGVSLKKTTLKPGASAKLKITVYGNKLNNLKRSPRVLVITNDPSAPKVTIDVKVTSK